MQGEANQREIREEFILRLKEKHGIELTPQVANIFISEIFQCVGNILLSGLYHRVYLFELGYLYFFKKPARKLHINLGVDRGKTIELPERSEVRFKPIERYKNVFSSV